MKLFVLATLQRHLALAIEDKSVPAITVKPDDDKIKQVDEKEKPKYNQFTPKLIEKVKKPDPSNIKSSHINWAKTQLMYALLNIETSTSFYETSLDKFKHCMKLLSSKTYSAWTAYHGHDGFSVFFKSDEEEKAFNEFIQEGYDRINTFGMKNIIAEFKNMPLTESN